MIPFLINISKDFLESIRLTSGTTSLFWIVEYSPIELGYEQKDEAYNSDLNRYTFLRNECLKNPTNFKERLDEHKYRIWTVVPQDLEW